MRHLQVKISDDLYRRISLACAKEDLFKVNLITMAIERLFREDQRFEEFSLPITTTCIHANPDHSKE